jgi:alkylhydroperoxidase/carboxymuconolactone decarboxylase family protein YurZ
MAMSPEPTDPTIETFMPASADKLLRLFERFDPRFAELWSTHLSRLMTRPQLDIRTRVLVMTGQYTTTGRMGQLEETIDAALEAGVRSSDILEVILQCYVYTGPWVVASACEAYGRVLERRSEAEDDVSARVDDGSTRRLDEERAGWGPADQADPRVAALMGRYGWRSIATGLRLRPVHHINLVDTLDALDPEYLQAWLEAIYGGMYGRRVLDDRTRILCVVGNTLAIGEQHQSRRHMRSALRNGATAKELLEVIFQTTGLFGHTHLMPVAIDDLLRIVDEEGRIEELVARDRIDDIRRIVAARVASRRGVGEIDLGEQSR